MPFEFNKNFDLSDYPSLTIGIISDTHTELVEPIQKIISECDIAIHAGDIGSLSVMELMKPKLNLVYAVSGNNDKPFLWDMPGWGFLKELPASIEIAVPGGLIAVEHGHEHDKNKPPHSSLRSAHPSAKVVIYGHTHHLTIDDSDDSCWVLNPGAAGTVRTHGGSSCLKLTAIKGDWNIESFRFDGE